MASIFYAEDERSTRNAVEAFLLNNGHSVRSFPTCDALLAAFSHHRCDLILLDIMTPGTDGLTATRIIRQSSSTPIVVLTAKASESDMLYGLELGIDSYIAKPFNLNVLLARINALLRRVEFDFSKIEKSEAFLTRGNVTLDTANRIIAVSGNRITLTPLEYELLAFLMGRFDEAVSKKDIQDAVWNLPGHIETRAVDETSRRLRKKLVSAGADIYIQTVWGYGFRLTKLIIP